MTIFEELRTAFRGSQDTYREYARASLIAAQQLAHEFREYLGAPENYADPDDETRRPYVRLLSFQLQDGAPVAAAPESQAGLLARDPDGYWRFAIALTLDRDADVFPKQNLAFFLRLKVHGGVWQVQLLDREFHDFRFTAAEGDGKRELFEHMVDMVRRLLDAKPWEGEEKLPIGFELQRPEPPTDEDVAAPLAQP